VDVDDDPGRQRDRVALRRVEREAELAKLADESGNPVAAAEFYDENFELIQRKGAYDGTLRGDVD
jgi:hypothetical protein